MHKEWGEHLGNTKLHGCWYQNDGVCDRQTPWVALVGRDADDRVHLQQVAGVRNVRYQLLRHRTGCYNGLAPINPLELQVTESDTRASRM